MAVSPRPLVANAAGEIVDLPGLRAAARAGDEVFPLEPADLVPLPPSSELLFLPARTPLGFDGATQHPVRDALAVAAFLPPGWTRLARAAVSPQSSPRTPCPRRRPGSSSSRPWRRFSRSRCRTWSARRAP